MNCEEALGAFAAHLDGEELPPAQSTALDSHLASCAHCRTQAKDLSAIHRDLLLEQTASKPGPSDKRDPIHSAQKVTASVPQPAHRPSIWLEAAAAMILAAVLAFLLWPGKPVPSPVPPEGSESTQGTLANVPSLPVLAHVMSVQGHVEATDTRSNAPEVLTPGSSLHGGQEIRVSSGSSAEIRMQDDVYVRLEASSVLRLAGNSAPGVTYLMSGRGRFDVAERKAPWRLQTPNATVESIGGVFMVTVTK